MLGKGADDQSLAEYTIAENRILVTYDDDFVRSFDGDELRAVLYLPNASLPVESVADIVHEVSKHYSQQELDGVEYVGTDWL